MNEIPEEPTIDPDHPWVEASLVGHPRPVEVSGRCEAYVLGVDGKTMDVGLMTFITPVGVFNFYMGPTVLGAFTMQCAETMDQITAGTPQQPGIVIANPNQVQEEAKRAEAANHLRSI